MDCEHCGAEMMLLRRSDADMGEILWFRCRVCDSGQMRSVPATAEPVADGSGGLVLRFLPRARRWLKRVTRRLQGKAG